MGNDAIEIQRAASPIDVPYEILCNSEQDRDAWTRLRRTGIGASEIAAVFGESRWRSAIELYAEKTGQGELSEEQTEAQFWGLRLERPIAEVYAARTGRTCAWSGLMLRSKAHPWALATLDALTDDGSGCDPWPFDSKTASAWKLSEWGDGPPREYYLQAQQQMLVTGAKRATLACLIGGQRLVWCDIERDEIEIKRITHMGRIFWEQSVLARVQPAPDGSKSAARALGELYPDPREGTVVLDASFDDLYAELSELKKTRAVLEKREDEIEQRFKAALGNATRGVIPTSRHAVSWAPMRGRVDYKRVAESLGSKPEMLDNFRGKGTRVFKLHDAREI